MLILKILLETKKFLNFKDDVIEYISHKNDLSLKISKKINKACLLRYIISSCFIWWIKIKSLQAIEIQSIGDLLDLEETN